MPPGHYPGGNGRKKVDFVLKNLAYVNVFSHEICHDDMAIFGDAITGFWHLSEGKGKGCAGQGTLPILPPEFFLSMNAPCRGSGVEPPILPSFAHTAIALPQTALIGVTGG